MTISAIAGAPVYLKPSLDVSNAKPQQIFGQGKPVDFDGKITATPEKLPDGTKVEILPTPNGGIPSLGGTARKVDVVELSVAAKAKLSETSENIKKTSDQLRGPVLSDSTKRTIGAFTDRIRAIVGQFKGQPDTQETRDKISVALKEAGLQSRQVRLTDPNSVKGLSANEVARRQLIISQFDAAYDSWRS